MNLFDYKTKLITQMPPIFTTSKELPKIPAYCIVKTNTWDLNIGDFVELEVVAYFNGKNFYYADISRYDSTDWITEWRYAKPNEF